MLDTKEKIKEWLDCYSITSYTINDDLSVDVDDNVYLAGKELTEIPIKFKDVIGYFDISYNKLQSLKNSPNFVRSNFYCNNNNLTSLENAPSFVGDHFICGNNQIHSIENFSSQFHGQFVDRSYSDKPRISQLQELYYQVNDEEVCYEVKLNYNDLMRILMKEKLEKTICEKNNQGHIVKL